MSLKERPPAAAASGLLASHPTTLILDHSRLCPAVEMLHLNPVLDLWHQRGPNGCDKVLDVSRGKQQYQKRPLAPQGHDCQATLAQSLTGTNEVCKASHKDTRLVYLLVPVLQRVSVSSSSNVELAGYKLSSDSV
ncbi:hypothetical protein BDM02DRAFT_3191778 [Thelephora ganbajun]|uniref:Uncharacterized protein n=1 Tax=Thelephora ganbajun TaxID=370292 RepID=A0ACB6Z1V2_THEGA|nr:hypothetical protein BDM02DRAFT_3191778 [Thelephora ganbajun]